MTTVTFIRHGESEANLHKLNGSQTKDVDVFDSPLTERGRAQARTMQKYIQSIEFDAIAVSPLIRACETAALIFENKDVKFHVKRSCREIQHNSPESQGRLKNDIINGSFGTKLNYRPALKDFPGGAEKFINLDKLEGWSKRWNDNPNQVLENQKNIQKLISMILSCNKKHVCIVCHGSVIRSLTGVKVPNCGMIKTHMSSTGSQLIVKNEFIFNAL